MTNYFRKPGLSSGKLSTAHNGGVWCPDMVLKMEEMDEAKLFWTPAMSFGHAFESIIQDMATGSDTFGEQFFRSDVQTAPVMDAKSTAAKIVWTQKYFHESAHKEGMLTDLMKINKDGSYRKGSEATNELADECICRSGGALPITKEDYKALSELAEKTIAMPIPKFWGAWPSMRFVGDFLGHSKCIFQEEFYWSRDGILKKGKTDCGIFHKDDNGSMAAIIDLKWTATGPNFEGRLKRKYWIQAQHYQEGVFEKYGVQPLPMLFVVGIGSDKNTPSMPTAMMVEDMVHSERDWCACSGCRLRKYEEICRKYDAWEKSGRGPVGFLPAREVRARI